MVLLTAIINNFSHYRAKRSDGLSCRNLKRVRKSAVNEDCCCSTSHAFDQVMEIERYYDAFPALGATVGSNCSQKVPLLDYNANSKRAKKMEKIHPTLPLSSKQGLKLKNEKNGHLNSKRSSCQNGSYRKHMHSGHKGVHPNALINLDCNQYFNKNPARWASKYSNPKPAKIGDRGGGYRGRHSKELNQKSKIARLESKPWKFLAEVEHTAPSSSEQPLSTVSQNDEKEVVKEFIAEDLLKAVLEQDDDVITDKAFVDKLGYLWNEENGIEESKCTWHYDDMKSEHIEELSPSIADEAKLATDIRITPQCNGIEDHLTSEISDFDSIEESLAALKFCDDIPDNCERSLAGSKLLPLFHENPISYMIQHGELVLDDEGQSPQLEAFTCKHCQETYEIVLESELADERKKPLMNGVLGLIDSRLDFDWCKYHPPPWSNGIEQEVSVEIKHNNELRLGCDCEFCRSRIWKRTCRWCATPI